MDAPPVKTVLENGVRVVSKTMTHTRSVSMGVWVDAGARDESLPENGLCHFIEHMIFKGTRRRSAYQIAKEFDAIGGQTNAFTGMEHTCYHARVLDAQAAAMADILADIFLNSLFDPGEVERERPVILQEIGMVEDTPEEYVHLLSGLNHWGDTPLGRPVCGSRENIARFDAETIRGFFHRLYQPERIVVAAAGNLDHGRLLEWVGPAFASVPRGNGFPERRPPAVRSQVALHDRALEQVHLCLSFPGVSSLDPRRYAFMLMNTLLGGNMSSRLFQEIRERRGLAYSVYSFIAPYVDAGMLGVYLAVAPEQALPAVEIVMREIARLQEEAVDAAELRGVIEYTKGSVLLASESTDNQMVRIAQNELLFGAEIPIDELVARIEAVGAEEIRQAAQTIGRREAMVLTLLGPAAAPPAAFERCLFA
jgi:predicted Zn-dependent peptidase